MLVDEFLPVYDISDAVATVVEADLARQTGGKAGVFQEPSPRSGDEPQLSR